MLGKVEDEADTLRPQSACLAARATMREYYVHPKAVAGAKIRVMPSAAPPAVQRRAAAECSLASPEEASAGVSGCSGSILTAQPQESDFKT